MVFYFGFSAVRNIKNLKKKIPLKIKQKKKKYDEISGIIEKYLKDRYGKKNNFKVRDGISNNNFQEVIYEDSKTHRLVRVVYDKKSKKMDEYSYTKKELDDRMKLVSEIVKKINKYMNEKYGEGFWSGPIDIEEDEEKYSVICLVGKNYQEVKISYKKHSGDIQECFDD